MLIVVDHELEKACLCSHRISGANIKQEDTFHSDLVTISIAHAQVGFLECLWGDTLHSLSAGVGAWACLR